MYTAESKKKTLQWLLNHSSNQYPRREDIEILRQETGIDTFQRMTSLLSSMRIKMAKDKNGKWCKRMMSEPASVSGNKRAWTQQNIIDMM